MDHIKVFNAICSLRPNAKFGMIGNEIDWQDTEQTQPTNEEIEAEIKRIEDEYQNAEYQRKRSVEYPPITEQLDALYHAGIFPEYMSKKIKEVKDKYPKPE